MLCRKINVVAARHKAFSLVELLISLLLSSVILMGLSSYYADFFKINSQYKELLLLQKDAHQLLNYFNQHIQHIYYQGKNRKESNYPLFQKNNKNVLLLEHCLVFFYDLNGDGCVGNRNKTQSCVLGNLNNTKSVSKEIFGFKLENGELYSYEDSSLENCNGELCQKLLTNCQTGKWRKITNLENYRIEQLKFSWYRKNVIEVNLKIASVQYNNLSYSANSYNTILNDEKNN